MTGRKPAGAPAVRRLAHALCLGLVVGVSCAGPAGTGAASPPAGIGPVAATTSAPTSSSTVCVSAAEVVRSAEAADRAMREIASSGSLADAHAAAERLAAALRELLPADNDGPPDGIVVALVKRAGPAAGELDRDALGGLATWARPRERYDQWRAVLAAWRPDRNTMPELPSHLLRTLGWASLVLRSDDLTTARALASVHGIIHTGLVLADARTAAGRPPTTCG